MKLFAVISLCLVVAGIILLFSFSDHFSDPSLQTKLMLDSEKFELTRDFADGEQIQIQIYHEQSFKIQDVFSW